jgi:hypothetical protein
MRVLERSVLESKGVLWTRFTTRRRVRDH